MKFLTDAMLGRLAEWLRILGYDTLSANDLPFSDDDYLLDIADSEERILLTRDRELFKRAKEENIKAVFVEPQKLEKQLAFLVKNGVISLEKVPSTERCPRCNGVLKKVPKETVKGHVPSAVYELHDEFWVCSSCGQVYWQGSHWKKMEMFIDKVKGLLEE